MYLFPESVHAPELGLAMTEKAFTPGLTKPAIPTVLK